MSLYRASNFAIGTLSAGINASQTSFSLQSGDGARFPDFSGSSISYCIVVYNSTDYPNPAADPSAEMMIVRGRTGDTFTTVDRGQEGTAAVSHNAPGKIYKAILIWPASQVQAISDKISGLIKSVFRAELTSDQQVPTGSPGSILNFTTESIDPGSVYSTTNKRFTAPAAGYYRARAQIYIASPSNGVLYDLFIQKNGNGNATGTTIARKTFPQSGTNELIIECSAIISLAAGDTLEAYLCHNAGSSQTVKVDYCRTLFEGSPIYSGA